MYLIELRFRKLIHVCKNNIKLKIYRLYQAYDKTQSCYIFTTSLILADNIHLSLISQRKVELQQQEKLTACFV